MWILILKVLYSAAFGVFGMVLWSRVSRPASLPSPVLFALAAIVGVVGGFAAGWALGYIGDPNVSQPLGALAGAMICGVALCYAAYANKR